MSGSCATTGLDADVCFGTCCVPPRPGEALRQNIIKALRDAGAWCGVCDYEDGPCTDCLATLGDYADDLLPVVRAYAAEELRDVADFWKHPVAGVFPGEDAIVEDVHARADALVAPVEVRL